MCILHLLSLIYMYSSSIGIIFLTFTLSLKDLLLFIPKGKTAKSQFNLSSSFLKIPHHLISIIFLKIYLSPLSFPIPFRMTSLGIFYRTVWTAKTTKCCIVMIFLMFSFDFKLGL